MFGGLFKSIEDLLRKNGAVISGSHLVLSSGKHSDAYINMRVLAGKTDPLLDIVSEIGEAISDYDEGLPAGSYPEEQNVVIVGPETLGRTLAELTSVDLNNNCVWDGEINFAWCDMKKDGNREWAEWNPKLNLADLVKGARCYIVDDLLTTAKSVKLVKDLIEATGGTVAGVVVAVRRDPTVTAETIGVPWLETLLDVELKTYEPDACPLCADQVPMTLRPGHGHEWVKDHPDYPVAE